MVSCISESQNGFAAHPAEVVQRADTPASVLFNTHYFVQTHRGWETDVMVSARRTNSVLLTNPVFHEHGMRQQDAQC